MHQNRTELQGGMSWTSRRVAREPGPASGPGMHHDLIGNTI